jgi:hypothetical protein
LIEERQTTAEHYTGRHGDRCVRLHEGKRTARQLDRELRVCNGCLGRLEAGVALEQAQEPLQSLCPGCRNRLSWSHLVRLCPPCQKIADAPPALVAAPVNGYNKNPSAKLKKRVAPPLLAVYDSDN